MRKSKGLPKFKLPFYEGYGPTGNVVADMMVQLVLHYNQQGRPLKTIYFKKHKYDTLMDFIKKDFGEEKYNNAVVSGMVFHFQGVMVKLASVFAIKDVSWDFKDLTPKLIVPKEVN
jgi:hypothetical protein